MSAVEWLYNKFSTCTSDEIAGNVNNWFKQAKELEEKQRDEFAIGFAKYIDKNYWQGQRSNQYSKLFGGNDKITIEELLEIYKKEKGL